MATMDIEAWLRSLGLERYEQAFRDHAIDLEILPELDEQHLAELGLPLGHRLKLLKAIRALGTAPAVESMPPPPPPERRQLTVMFVDLVGSTALSARLDPEEMQELLRAYQRAVAKAIGRFGGRVAKLLGDGVLAYFGWPVAHEDDAEQAVHAGLAAVQAVTGLRVQGEPLAARVGIATGVVVVGELIGEGAAQEEMVVGETPNLAARLQALAEPGSVVVAERTRRVAGGLFE
jgi:class 3 adenylate cyclase